MDHYIKSYPKEMEQLDKKEHERRTEDNHRENNEDEPAPRQEKEEGKEEQNVELLLSHPCYLGSLLY
jgi:hypothetical protein